MNEKEEWDESEIPTKPPHKPQLREGLHKARIVSYEVLRDQSTFNNPKKLRDVIRYDFDINGVTLRKSYTLTDSEMGSLYKLFKKLLNVDISKEKGRKGSELQGVKCQVEVEYSEPTSDGSVWERITNVLAADQTFEDDSEDETLLN